MTKRKQNLVIVALLFALLLGLVFLLISMPMAKNDTEKEDATQVFANLIDTTDKKISSIAVKNGLGEYELRVEEKDDKQVYVLEGLDESKTAQANASMLVDSLINLKPMQILDDENLDLSMYGLNSTEAQLTVTFDNDEQTILMLGADAPLSQGSYVKLESDPKVYLIEPGEKEIFLNEKSFYLEAE